MGVIEIIAAFLLIIACVFIVVIVLLQESKQGMSNVITGGNTDNYYQKNSGRTREAKLARATKAAAIAVFIIAIGVNLISVYFSGDSDSGDDAPTPAITDSAETGSPEDTEAPEETGTSDQSAEETEPETTTAAQ